MLGWVKPFCLIRCTPSRLVQSYGFLPHYRFQQCEPVLVSLRNSLQLYTRSVLGGWLGGVLLSQPLYVMKVCAVLWLFVTLVLPW
jgi:hypothetical protein